MHEPESTAVILAVLGVLMALSVVGSRLAGRVSVPITLVFLGIGMAAGSEGLGGIAFESYGLAFRLGTVALVLILFDGGLGTSYAAVKRALVPATLLATVGVVLTAALVGVAARLCGFAWPAAFLLGAVVSSTDASAVFSVLRGRGIDLPQRVATTLELESGLNDPVAVILTLAVTGAQVSGRIGGGRIAFDVAVQLVVGLLGGVAVGGAARLLFRRVQPTAAGLWPVLTVAVAFAAFGLTTLAGGSGFLATYAAAVIVGNTALPYRSGLVRVHDALAWIAQVVMFLVLGLLSFPSRLAAVAGTGLVLGLALALVARPLAVAACLVPFRFPARELGAIAWIGLRGAVPIILAIFPVLAGAPDAHRIFDVVFFIVVVNAFVPGATVRQVTRWLGIQVAAAPPPSAVLEIASTRPLHAEILSFYIDTASAVAGARIADVPFPEEAAVVLIVRGDALLPAKGDSTLERGDHVYVFCRPQDRAGVCLLFGREET